MNTRALAVVLPAAGEVEVSSVTLGELGARDVLVRSLFSGVSTGTDKWVMLGSFTWIPVHFPLVPGYQRFGIVEAVGDEVANVVVGQEVVATESRPFLDALPAWGGHAALAITNCDEVFDATGIQPERASLFISAQVGFNAVSRILDHEDHRVVVYGDGIIGVSAALAAKACGYDVLLVGRHPERMDALPTLGITTARNGHDSAAAVRDWVGTAVIDTIQNESAFDEYIDTLTPATGQVVFSGHTPGGVKDWADLERIQQRELTVSFVSGWTRKRIEGTLALMRDGYLPLETLAAVTAATSESIAGVMNEVLKGSLQPVAAILDWRQLQ